MKKLLFLLAIPMALSVTSCKKAGCTDVFATNYNSKAKTNDGTCTYQEKLIFWQDATEAGSWSSLGITGLKFYVDNQYIGSCVASEYMVNGQPTCSGTGQASTSINLGLSKSKVVTVELKDQNDNSLGTDNVTITAGSCSTYQF